MLLNNRHIGFATKKWFSVNQILLLFLVNNPIPMIRERFRDSLGIIHVDPKIKVHKITPNAVIYNVDKEFKQGAFYSANHFEWNIKNEFERLLMPFHKWDIKFANVFAPALNLGYDTLSVYSSTSDGYIFKNNADWATARAATSGTTGSASGLGYSPTIEASLDSGYYYISRAFFYYNTSAMGAGKTVSECKFYIRFYSTNSGDVSIQEGTQADPYVTGDFDAFTGSQFGTFASGMSTSSMSNTTLTSGCYTLVNNNAAVKMCLRNYTRDYSNSAPGGLYQCGNYFADYTGTSRDPYIYVTYTTAASSNIKTVNGIAIGSTAKINTVAKASVKEYIGVA